MGYLNFTQRPIILLFWDTLVKWWRLLAANSFLCWRQTPQLLISNQVPFFLNCFLVLQFELLSLQNLLLPSIRNRFGKWKTAIPPILSINWPCYTTTSLWHQKNVRFEMNCWNEQVWNIYLLNSYVFCWLQTILPVKTNKQTNKPTTTHLLASDISIYII